MEIFTFVLFLGFFFKKVYLSNFISLWGNTVLSCQNGPFNNVLWYCFISFVKGKIQFLTFYKSFLWKTNTSLHNTLLNTKWYTITYIIVANFLDIVCLLTYFCSKLHIHVYSTNKRLLDLIDKELHTNFSTIITYIAICVALYWDICISNRIYTSYTLAYFSLYSRFL